MTTIQFLEDLAEELKEELAHLQFPCEITGETTGIQVFQYGLPIERTINDKKKKFPYVLILPEEGELGESTQPQDVKVYMLIGIYDKDMENQGKRHVLNVIHDICERFQKNPVLKGRYYADEKITWVVDKEEEYPYHYGAVWMVFHTAAIRRENEYA